jgi:adenylosuccinate synthase
LDPEYNYPYVSTTTVTSAAMCMAGIPPNKIDEIIGITKVYSTYVGNGPYKTEIDDQELSQYIARIGNEYGTTTQRPRRIGHLDLVMLRYACKVNGCTSLCLTKADVVIGQRMKVCVAYELDGKTVYNPPMLTEERNRAKPIYEEVQVKTGREFIPIVEEATKIPVKFFSFGAERSQIEEL